jgi:hypothetical protein
MYNWRKDIRDIFPRKSRRGIIPPRSYPTIASQAGLECRNRNSRRVSELMIRSNLQERQAAVTKHDLSQIVNPHANPSPHCNADRQAIYDVRCTAYRDPEPAQVPNIQQTNAGQRATCCQ